MGFPIDLKGYEPLESYFMSGRLWYRCAIFRYTTGLVGENALRVVNAPCIIGSLQTSPQATEQYIAGTPAAYRLTLPAAYRHPITGEIVRLKWGPDEAIYDGDTIFVWGLPFLVQVRALRNPLTIFSHFELEVVPRTVFAYQMFSDFVIPDTTFSLVTPPEDIMPIVREVMKILDETVLASGESIV